MAVPVLMVQVRVWINRVPCRVAASISRPSQGRTRATGMNWKSGCGWFFAVYLFVAVILTVFGVQPAVAVWVCLAISVFVLTRLHHWRREEALPPTPELRRPARRRTSVRTTRQSPRPHWRRAHWHAFWIGPRDDPSKRTKIMRRLDPIHVGGARGPHGRQPTSVGSLCPHCHIGPNAHVVPGARYCPYCGKLDCRGHRASLRPLYCPYCGALKL